MAIDEIRIDPVAAKFPLLATIGDKPDWIPFDWSEAAWPIERTRNAVLQFVDWLLLYFNTSPESPAKQEKLQWIGSYRRTLLDGRSLLFILREQGECTIECPKPSRETDRETTVDELRELRTKLIEESKGNAETEGNTVKQAEGRKENRRFDSFQDGKSVVTRRGRKSPNPEDAKHDVEVANQWKKSKEAGVYKSDFVKDHNMSVQDLDRLLKRVSARQKRSQ